MKFYEIEKELKPEQNLAIALVGIANELRGIRIALENGK